MKTAVIYARYSSERQTEQSIEGQIRECTEYAKRHDILIEDTYIDRAMTGTNDNRSAFQKMLKDCSKQAWDIVLVYKLDRFSRNKYEMAMHRRTLRDNDIKLISAKENIPDSPEGIIIESQLEGMAEYYSAELSQKVRRGMRESRIKGHYTGGGLPYGYKIVNKKPVVDEFKAKVVIRIFKEYLENKYAREIVDGLTNDGIFHKDNKPFAIGVIHKMLRNEKYSGICHYDGETFENYYPRIVPQALYDLVQRKIQDNHYGKRSDEKYLLKNKITCGLCGKPIASESGTAKNGSTKRYYKCMGRKHLRNCKKTILRKELLEDLVIDITLKVLDNEKNAEMIANKILEVNKQQVEDDSTIIYLENQKKEKQKTLDNIMLAIEQGIITSTTKQRLEELEQNISEIDEQILTAKSENKVRLNKSDILRFYKKALKKSPALMIYALVNKVILYDDKIEIYYNYTSEKGTDENDHQPFLFYSEKLFIPIKDYSYNNKNRNLILDARLFV